MCRRLLLYHQGWQLGCRKLYRQEMARSSLSPPTRFILRAGAPCPRTSLGLMVQLQTTVVSSTSHSALPIASICPNPDNQTCCFNGQGVEEVKCRNNGPPQTVAALLRSCHSANTYTIPISTSSASGSNTTQASASTSSSAPVTSTSASQLPAAPSTAPSSLSTSEQAGIAVGTIAGFCD